MNGEHEVLDGGIDHLFAGGIDKRLRRKYLTQWVRCPNGHLNSPNADICWKCERKIERAICEKKDRSPSIRSDV